MNKLFKFPFLMAFAIALGTGFASCSDDDDTDSDHNVGGAGTVTAETFKSVLEQYVNYTVIPTYKTLADKAIILDKAVNRLNEDRSDANLAVACLAWRDARQYWELSESFLYGAAADYSIDPHIDSWPLDKTALDNLLGNNYLLDNFVQVIWETTYWDFMVWSISCLAKENRKELAISQKTNINMP